jgi:NAD(P)-dependent dehydrogenase (short-subunit alcohol dehydrogenase family)
MTKAIDDFSGRPGAALETGGTGGIGAAICRMLAERGSAVAFTYRANTEAAATLEGELTRLGVREERCDHEPAFGKPVDRTEIDRPAGAGCRRRQRSADRPQRGAQSGEAAQRECRSTEEAPPGDVILLSHRPSSRTAR